MKMITLPALAAYLEPFTLLFRRSIGRDSLEAYENGLLTGLTRKNCESIAQTEVITSLEQLQHLLTGAAWDPLAEEQRVRMVMKHRQANVAVVLDNTGLPKYVKTLAAIHYQYSGTDAASEASANSSLTARMWSMILV